MGRFIQCTITVLAVLLPVGLSVSRAQPNGASFLESYLDPSNPKVVFAVFDSASLGGVYLLQSQDGGQTWAKVVGPDGSAVRKYGQQNVTDFFVRVGPKPNARLIITYSAVDKLWRAGPDLQWQRFAVPEHFMFDQLVSLPHPDRFFAIVRKSEKAEGRSSALFRTETGGASWVRVRDSLPFTCDILVHICEILASSDGKALIGEGFVSRDGGSTWKDIAPDEQVQAVAAIEAAGPRTWPIEGTVAQVAAALRALSKSMEAGQLSKQSMPETKVTREETSPKGERATGPNAQFIEALKELETALFAKIDSDVETTARAFWDAYNIQRSRRVADFVLAPLTVIEQAIGTVSFAKNISEIFTRIDRAENILQVVSLFMGLGQLNQVGQNLQVAIDGPAYSSLLKAMLTEAAASTQPGEYATTVKLHLYGIGGRNSPIGIPHRGAGSGSSTLEVVWGAKATKVTLHLPAASGASTLEVVWGAEAVKRRISEDIAKLIKELEAKPVGAGVQVEAIRTHLATLTETLKRSRADNVTVASAAVLPAAGSSPDLLLGSIGALEQVRREALTQYDNDLRLEQISVLSSTVKAGTQVISLKVGYKTPGGKLLKEVQRDVITPGAVVVNTLAKTYRTTASHEVSALPHEMVLSLPGELASTWKLLDSIVAIVRTSLTATTVAGGAKDALPAVQRPAEPGFSVSTCTHENRYEVKGIIPLSVDLADEGVAKAYIEKAKDYAFQHCQELQALKPTQGFNGMVIALYHGDDRLKPVPDVRGDYCGRHHSACHGWFGITLERAVKEGIKNYTNVVRRRQEINAGWEAWKAENGNLVRAAESQPGAAATYRLIDEVGNTPICARNHVFLEIAVDVPSEVDLASNRLAEAYMGLALDNAFRWCDGGDRDIWHYPQGRPWSVRVSLNQNGKRKVAGEIKKDASSGTYSDKRWNQFVIRDYKNFVPEQRKAAEEAKRRAEQKEAALRPIRERFNAFFRRHGVGRAVSCDSLERNPFALEGQTIAMKLRFEQMIAKDQGVLGIGSGWGGGCGVAVSGIPHGTFSTQRVEVLLAGKVLGNTKVTLGPVTLLVPHLKFVGVHICKDENCSDIVP